MTSQYGWLPDPERPGMLRWWNGSAWLDNWQPGNQPILSDAPDRSPIVVAAPRAIGPKAGWLSDPEHPGFLRWWDGGRWTEHRQAVHSVHLGRVDHGEKSAAVAYLLLLLLGGFGTHRFYLGRMASAVGFLVLYWLGVAGATAAIEAANGGGNAMSPPWLLLLCFCAVTIWFVADLFRIPAMTREANEHG